MTYEDAYLKCENVEELLKEIKKDIATATIINTDRIPVIVKIAESVMNKKFNEDINKYITQD